MPKQESIQKYLLFSLKLILFLSILNAAYNHYWHIMSTNIFLLILLFTPNIITNYKVEIPAEFELILLIFVIFTFFLKTIGGIIAPISFGIAVAMIGFMILAILYSSNQIKKNYFLIIFFSFNFAVTFGLAVELAKYYLKIMLGQEFSAEIYAYSMQNMTLVILGALISSIMGYFYMKYHPKILRNFITKIIRKNPKLFQKSESGKEEIFELIKNGENEKLEFKSTLRTNLHTNEIDRKIEYSALKTIAAFMNSDGGTLLIGIEDSGRIIGIEEDKFENTDKCSLHLTNILKSKIGKKNISLVNFKFAEIDGKTVLKIVCEKSKSPVFIKSQTDEEELYIRAGPSSVQIKGSELVDYIEKNFRKD